jgi:hypothetical protein
MQFKLRQTERKMLAKGELLLPDFNLVSTRNKMAAVRRLATMGLVELGMDTGTTLQFRTVPHTVTYSLSDGHSYQLITREQI